VNAPLVITRQNKNTNNAKSEVIRGEFTIDSLRINLNEHAIQYNHVHSIHVFLITKPYSELSFPSFFVVVLSPRFIIITLNSLLI
jgi:hypothetical protein